MIPTQLEQLHRDFWTTFHSQFNLSTNEGCGLYTESWVKYAQNRGWPKVQNLKKNPGQTQYNGHANDAFLYTDGVGNEGGLYAAVDLIAGAEGPSPSINWGVDIPRYKDSDVWSGGVIPVPAKTVPWLPYDENSFQRLKKMLKHDYDRRPQGPDYDVSVWAGRYFHNCYMGPEGTPLGEQKALEKIKPELCSALGIPVDNYYGVD